MGLIYRPITSLDVEPMAAFALAAIPEDPALMVSSAKVRGMVEFFATHNAHFQMAAFDGLTPVAGLAAFVTPMPFHERNEMTVCFCFSCVAGAGMVLLRMLMAEVRQRMDIRRVVWAMNPGFDDRIVSAARRLGFTSAHPTFVFTKGA